MAYHVSSCCQATVFSGTKVDPKPLGSGEYNGAGIKYLIDVCEDCRKETEPVDACESCGEAREQLFNTIYGDWCEPCIMAYAKKEVGSDG